jgi:hypothetical protein
MRRRVVSVAVVAVGMMRPGKPGRRGPTAVTPLTLRRLRAIEFAIDYLVGSEADEVQRLRGIKDIDVNSAAQWCRDVIAQREAKRKRTAP